MDSYTLISSDSTDALVNAIEHCISGNENLILKPGVHLTRPGYGDSSIIKVGSKGLTISGDGPGECVIIKRPDFTIGVDLPSTDDNYGLFFIPEDPTDVEVNTISSWKTYTNEDGTVSYEFAVLIKGTIEICNVSIDCNMHQQNAETIPSNEIEHSCMLSFSGIKHTMATGPHAGKVVFTAFERVTIKNMISYNGGYADDIWISRGYFNPNILEVQFDNVVSKERRSPKRATISFSGIVQRVIINNCKLNELHCEDDTAFWRNGPRLSDNLFLSQWHLSNITAEIISIAAKGQIVEIFGNNLYTSTSMNLYQVAGVIKIAFFIKAKSQGLIG